MEKGVNEKDWKLFRSRLPGWQETYMERIRKLGLDVIE